jgi:hypothetical protein
MPLDDSSGAFFWSPPCAIIPNNAEDEIEFPDHAPRPSDRSILRNERPCYHGEHPHVTLTCSLLCLGLQSDRRACFHRWWPMLLHMWSPTIAPSSTYVITIQTGKQPGLEPFMDSRCLVTPISSAVTFFSRLPISYRRPHLVQHPLAFIQPEGRIASSHLQNTDIFQFPNS